MYNIFEFSSSLLLKDVDKSKLKFLKEEILAIGNSKYKVVKTDKYIQFKRLVGWLTGYYPPYVRLYIHSKENDNSMKVCFRVSIHHFILEFGSLLFFVGTNLLLLFCDLSEWNIKDVLIVEIVLIFLVFVINLIAHLYFEQEKKIFINDLKNWIEN